MSRRSLRLIALALGGSFALAACDGCKNDNSSGDKSSPSAAVSHEPALQRGAGLGLNFSYPEPYQLVVSTSNPNANQIAVSSDKAPGVLTIQLNTVDPTGALNLDQQAENTRLTMDPSGTIEPTSMKVGTQSFDARAVKSASLGMLPETDVVAVVPIGGRNYLVKLHSANEDVGKAAKMFALVLGTLKAD
jgi:hypothetical protein